MCSCPLVKISRAAANQDRLPAIGQLTVGSDSWVKDVDAHDPPILVLVGGSEFIPKTYIHREFRRDLPDIFHIGGIGSSAKERAGQRVGGFKTTRLPQHEVRERKTGGGAVGG